MSQLFQPLDLHGTTLRNRLWVAPMCQYSVEACDGVPAAWHAVHYGALTLGGWGLVLTEATAVNPEGRISPQDTGLWNDEQADAWAAITGFAHQHGAVMGVQLAHAGRKASDHRGFPGEPTGSVPPDEGGWTPVGPTTDRFDAPGFTNEVRALDEEGIAAVVDDFRSAARRAAAAGFDVVEVHAAHGYLLHEFLSPLSNTRDDQWGGAFENRTRLLLSVVDAVREVWQGPLFVRISATDWVDGGWSGDDSVRLSHLLRGHDVDLVDVSTGGNLVTSIPLEPGYQVRFADQVRRGASLPTSAVGLVTTAEQAEAIVAEGRADAVMMARQALREPSFALRAAHELGVDPDRAGWPAPRLRGRWH